MAILKEIEVLVRQSVAERGTLRIVNRCAVVGRIYLWHRIREMRRWPRQGISEFDRTFGVDTDGARSNNTRLRNLDIASPNWVHAVDYIPVKPVVPGLRRRRRLPVPGAPRPDPSRLPAGGPGSDRDCLVQSTSGSAPAAGRRRVISGRGRAPQAARRRRTSRRSGDVRTGPDGSRPASR